ncbi:MAG: hypothetical protein R3C14_54130 [Caldilineaceae bacterium]
MAIIAAAVGYGVARRRAQREIQQHLQQITRVQRELESEESLNRQKQREATALHEELSKWEAMVAGKENELAAAQSALSELQMIASQVAEEQQKVLSLTTELSVHQQKLTKLTEDYSSQQTRLSTLQQQQTEQDATIAALQAEVAAEAQARQAAEAAQADLAETIEERAQQLAALAQKYQAAITLRSNVTNTVEELLRLLQQTPADEMPLSAEDNEPESSVSSDGESPTGQANDPTAGDTAAILDEPTAEEVHKLELFLNSKNIQLKYIPAEDATDAIINDLALTLGDHYEVFRRVYQLIKRNMQKGDPFTLSLKGEAAGSIGRICQFCKKLHEFAFLEEYKYFKSPSYLLRARTTALPKAQNFFSGLWLERYLMQKVQSAIMAVTRELNCQVDFAYLLNPRIILPNGADSELDLIFQVNAVVYWIEAKTGDYQQHISKYSKLSRMMNLDDKHAIMVLPDIQTVRSEQLSTLFAMSVYSLSDFEPALLRTLKQDLLEQATTTELNTTR